MIPSSDRNGGAGVARPPGVLPKNVHYLVLGGITLLIVVSSMFSGRKAPKVEESKATTGPTASQLKNFQQMLEQRRREAEEAKKRLDEAQTKQEQHTVERRNYTASSAPDPEEAKRRARAAAAPFASSISLRVLEKEEEPEPDRSSQIVVRLQERPELEGRTSAGTIQDQPEAEESGQLLRAKEGDLYRLYEGTTIKAVLVNRLDGSFTGPVITTVVEDVRAKADATLLIPKGSRFIGKATRVEAQRQTRLAVSFSRLLMPNGYSVKLDGAPGLDRFGETGLKDKVDNHYKRTFGLSGAIGLLGGLALYGTQASPFARGIANTTGGSAMNTLSRLMNDVPKITIREGHDVVVYLPKDLLLPEFHP